MIFLILTLIIVFGIVTPAPEDDLSRLWQRLASGDERAMEIMFGKKWYPYWIQAAVSITHDPSDALDVVQNVSLILFRLSLQGKLNRSVGSVKSYLRTMIRNEAKQLKNQQQRMRKSMKEYHTDHLVMEPEEEDPFLSILERLEQKQLDQAYDAIVKISGMSQSEGNVWRMYYLEGLKPRECADKLGKTPNTVRVLRHKADQKKETNQKEILQYLQNLILIGRRDE